VPRAATGPRRIVSDLDGTLADVQHRLHLILRDEPDWTAFFLACGDDAPIAPTITVLRTLHEAGFEVVLASGRGEVAREATVDWLARHDVPWDRLLLRRSGDRRHDDEVKAEMVHEHGLDPADTLVVLEDRASVVQVWRRLGFHVFQVADGDF
jgi:phosphoglycolate phosphatase-like HAD superfamily hydrolase